jgi:hypothetical protein
LDRRLGGTQSWSGRSIEKKNLSPTGNRSLAVQPVTCLYTGGQEGQGNVNQNELFEIFLTLTPTLNINIFHEVSALNTEPLHDVSFIFVYFFLGVLLISANHHLRK